VLSSVCVDVCPADAMRAAFSEYVDHPPRASERGLKQSNVGKSNQKNHFACKTENGPFG